MRIKLIFINILMSLFLAACHIRGGEPSQSELFSALQDRLEHTNDRGGIKINMGNAGAFKEISFNFKLRALIKHSCTGSHYAYTCKVTLMLSYPPVKDDPDMVDSELIVFDGPGGWRVVE